MAAFGKGTTTGTGDILIKLDKESCVSTAFTVEVEYKEKPKFRRFGDMIYFEETKQMIPIRKPTPEVRVRVLKELK